MAAPSTFFSLPHCHAVLHCRTQTPSRCRLGNFNLSPFIHSSSLLLYSGRATPTSSTWTAWCRPPRRDRRRPPRSRGGRSSCSCRRARPPEVARGHPTSPEATRGCSRPSERTTANRGRNRGGIFPARLPDRVLIRLIKLISRFRLIDDDAAGERAAEVVHFPILRGLPPPEFPREKND